MAVVLAIAMVPLVVTFGCGGHSIRPGFPFHAGGKCALRTEFDFKKAPQCASVPEKAPRTPGCANETTTSPPALDEDGNAVVVRYLGAGGVFVGWRGEAILFAPFFSNPGKPSTLIGRVQWDEAAIKCRLQDMGVTNVGAIIAGHSHYDHIGDLPVVAKYEPNATLLVNRSGRNALESYSELVKRVRLLETLEKRQTLEARSTQLQDVRGRYLPFRVRVVASRHAPHLWSFELWKGTTKPRPKEEWEDHRRWSSLRVGWTYAFVVDLTDDKSPTSPVRFRMFMQDSASLAPAGMPPHRVTGDSPYDLAILGMASSQFVKPYPEDLLRRIEPRHVLGIHYENFTEPWGPRRGFAPLLTRRVADRFLCRVECTLAATDVAARPPRDVPCGPSTDRWTMPLPGERLVFRVGDSSSSDQRACGASGVVKDRRTARECRCVSDE